MKGAAGWRWRCFLSTFATVRIPSAARRMASSASRTAASLVKVNCSTFSPACGQASLTVCAPPFPWRRHQRGSTVFPRLEGGYFVFRSTIRRNAGLCTLPAESPRLIFFPQIGYRLSPQVVQAPGGACCALITTAESSRGDSMASLIALLVIS